MAPSAGRNFRAARQEAHSHRGSTCVVMSAWSDGETAAAAVSLPSAETCYTAAVDGDASIVQKGLLVLQLVLASL